MNDVEMDKKLSVSEASDLEIVKHLGMCSLYTSLSCAL